ncbi:MAG: hypothetical protein WBY94_20785 [Polyangiaceae bacterium]
MTATTTRWLEPGVEPGCGIALEAFDACAGLITTKMNARRPIPLRQAFGKRPIARRGWCVAHRAAPGEDGRGGGGSVEGMFTLAADGLFVAWGRHAKAPIEPRG